MTKTSVKLSSRLQMIANIVPNGTNFADIGADHGHLIAYLKENNLIDKAYASDNKKGPYLRLCDNLKGLDIKVDLADGIRKIPSYINCVCIAGMGGDTVVSIINESIDKLANVEYFVISSHGLLPEVRKCLFDLGYSLISQDAIFDPEPYYYEVNLFKKVKNSYTDVDVEYGTFLINSKNQCFIKNIEYKMDSLNQILSKESIPESKKNSIKNELERYQKLLKTIKDM